MNLERDEGCGAAPGVMGHLACTNRNCSCNNHKPVDRKLRQEYEPRGTDYGDWYSNPKREREVIPPAAVDFLYVAHQTQKAMLFALKDGRQQWVPKSLILSIDEPNNRVMIAGWFARTIL